MHKVVASEIVSARHADGGWDPEELGPIPSNERPIGRLIRRASDSGFGSRAPFGIIHLQLQAPSGDHPRDTELAQVARWIVLRVLASRRSNAMPAFDGSATTLLVPDASRVGATVRPLIDDITMLARRHDPALQVTCGIGRTAATLAEVEARTREAMSACRLGTTFRGAGSTTRYADLGPYDALHAALTGDDMPAAIESLEERYLGAAVRHEAAGGMPLLETLSVFFDERCNVSATARTLRVNRQSLIYRLERFQELADVDLGSALDRFALELALRCWRMRAHLARPA